jgi:plasmid stability protein
MTVRTLTLNLPEILYTRLERRAEQANRSVEDELLEVLTTAVPVADELPADLEEAISPLALLDDEALWRAARSPLPAEVAAQLQELHLERQREGLSEAKAETLSGLVRQYERALLVRSQAIALLHQRGHDVSQLLGAA